MHWAMAFNLSLGEFYDCEKLVPVASAHFAPDLRMGGPACMTLLMDTVAGGGRVRVPAYLDPCSVDFGRAAELIAEYGLTKQFVAEDRKLQELCRQVGFIPTYTCIAYQTISPPAFAQHLAWGDTGTAIMANAVFGARTNFEGGPSALASALLGHTPAYGMHLPASRKGNLKIKLDCTLEEGADWGAVAACAGAFRPGYDTVPVFYGAFEAPDFPMLKQLGVALASYGGHAMFHLVGVTPEARTVEEAFGTPSPPTDDHVITQDDLNAVFDSDDLGGNEVDVVVFAAPQLAIDEIIAIRDKLAGRNIHANTKLIIALDPQVKLQANTSGISQEMMDQGVEFSTGTCFYPEAPLMLEATGWKTLVTNSAKLANTLKSSEFRCAFRRLGDCIEAAVTGRLAS